MRRALALVLAACALALAAPATEAFDGRREGFVLGFGAGAGYVGYDTGLAGLATRLDVGVGLDDRTLVHYAGRQVLHSSDGLLFTQAFPLLGVTHHLKPEAPGPFLTGGLGGAFLIAFDHGEVGVGEGLTAFGGGGFEFTRHWTVELDVAYTSTPGKGVTSVLATVGFLSY
jgi:hypothetical protein